MVGLILDRFGAKRILTLACLFCVLGNFLFASTKLLVIAKLGRFLIGFGSAFVFIGLLKLSTQWFPASHLGLAVGLVITIGTLGAMIGNILLGKLIESLYWQTTLQLLTLAGVILIPLIWFYVSEPKKSNQSIRSTQTQTLKAIGKEIIQLSRSSQIWINALIGCILYLPTSAFNELWGHSCLLNLHGLCNSDASTAISMTFLGWAIGSPVSGLLSDKMGKRKILLQFSCLSCIILFCIIIYSDPISALSLHWLLFLFGLFSSPQILIFVIAKDYCKKEFTATLFAFNNFIIMMGALICQPLIGKLLDFYFLSINKEQLNNLSHTNLYHSADTITQTVIHSGTNYSYALSILPVLLLFAFGLSFLLKTK